MVGPEAASETSATFEVVPSVVQPETSAPKSTQTARARADALCPDPTTRAPPCDPALRFLPTPSPAEPLSTAKLRVGPAIRAPLMPAKAGSQLLAKYWVPASAGTSGSQE